VKEKMTDRKNNCSMIETVYNVSELKSCPSEPTTNRRENDEQNPFKSKMKFYLKVHKLIQKYGNDLEDRYN
jgi:hypothetical protein